MPAAHRRVIEEVESMPSLRDVAGQEPFNAVLEAMAVFREVHYGWGAAVYQPMGNRSSRDRWHALHAMAETTDRRN